MPASTTPPVRLKARLCVEGRRRLYAYCAEHTIAHKRAGKLIVASEADEMRRIAGDRGQCAPLRVDDLQFLTRGEAESLEPALTCAAALLSPSTGIVDSHALMLSLRGDLEAAGVPVLSSPRSPGRRSTPTASGSTRAMPMARPSPWRPAPSSMPRASMRRR